MQMTLPRYAIYIAPAADQPLWQFGSRVLGYDAATGCDIHGFAPVGLTAAEWRGLTERPRHYGFHATLKAPFRLAEDVCLAGLDEALDEFCRARPAFDLGPLAMTSLSEADDHGFVALTQSRQSEALAALEMETVTSFDRFRAPLSPDELLKRKPDSLTRRQKTALEQFGYPFIGPDYRFHMTLSTGIQNVADIADRLADALANEIGAAHLVIDALVLFGQENRTERFRILKRYELRKQ